MKKALKVSMPIIISGMFFLTGCGEPVFTIDYAMSKGFDVQKGMTKEQVKNILKVEPTMKKRDGDFELWIYEGQFTNEDTDKIKYKNITVKFRNGKVVYPAYFECPVPKVED
jgi:major membrane immunogen (membrane-anchored lipoprotein)